MTLMGRISRLAPAIAWLAFVPQSLEAQDILHCRLLPGTAGQFSGRCVWDNASPMLQISLSRPSGGEARWRGMGHRIFPGRNGQPEKLDSASLQPTFADLGKPNGTFASSIGWNVIVSTIVTDTAVKFDIDVSRKSPPTRTDLEILQLARSYLLNASKWNRNDSSESATGACPQNAAKRSIFCALRDAELSLDTEFHTFRPGVDAIRGQIALWAEHDYQHPLIAFNNDSTTTFAIVRAIFDDAIANVKQRLILRGVAPNTR